MTDNSVSISMVTIRVSVQPKYTRNTQPGDNTISLEIIGDSCRLWYCDGNICGETYRFTRTPLDQQMYRRLTDIPHFAEVFRYVSGQYAANRSNPLGAFLRPMAVAMETELAEREGSCVYFAEAGGRIKIGWSKKVASRVAQLQTGSASPIRLLGVIPGGRAQERRLHEQFAQARLSGEWFEATPDLLAYITTAIV